MDDLEFQRSSFCDAGSCVEVADDQEHGWVVIRSTIRPDRHIRFTPEEWADFVNGVKAGEFDV